MHTEQVRAPNVSLEVVARTRLVEVFVHRQGGSTRVFEHVVSDQETRPRERQVHATLLAQGDTIFVVVERGSATRSTERFESADGGRTFTSVAEVPRGAVEIGNGMASY